MYFSRLLVRLSAALLFVWPYMPHSVAQDVDKAARTGGDFPITSKNLLDNPSFEAGLRSWAVNNQDNAGTITVVDGHLEIRREKLWKYFRAFQDISVKPNWMYVLHYRAKVAGQGTANVVIHQRRGDDEWEYSTSTVTSPEWESVTLTVPTKADVDTVRISLMTGGKTKGHVVFDDLSFKSLPEDRDVTVPSLGEETVSIDGKTDEAAWENAVSFGDFRVNGKPRQKASPPTEGMLGIQDNHLVVACTFTEPAMDELVVSDFQTPMLHNNDCVELFVGPNRKTFYQFIVNPAGVTHVNSFGNKGRGKYVHDWYPTEPAKEAFSGDWEASATRGAESWTVEARIPLAALYSGKDTGKNPVLLMNIVRHRPHGKHVYSNWACLTANSNITPSQFIPVRLAWKGGAKQVAQPGQTDGYPRRLGFTKRMTRPYMPQAGQAVKISCHPGILPLPGDLNFLETNVSINDGVKDLVRRGVCRDNAYVATVDVHLAIETRKKLFGHLSEADRKQLSSDEAFKLEIAADDISISAAAPEGVLRGLATLGVLGSAGKSKPAPALAQMVMYDAPRLDFRGMILSPYNNPEAVKPQIDILFLLRMNAVFPFIYSYMGPTPFPFSSHPGIGGDTSTKEDWEELAAYARARGIKVIPFHHAWSKAGYILSQPRYRHLAVRPDLDVGTRRKSAIFKNFCVSHPESAPLIHDLIEEVVDTMDLEHFFIGHDEIQFDDMNTNPRDKARDLTRWQYVLETAMKTYDVLKEQGVTMYMWADMLDPYHNGGALEMSGEKLLEKFPKDIVMMYWWYGVPLTPFLETLIAEGYPTIGCPWHNPKNVAQTIGTVYRNGGMGYCQTVWNATSPNALSANLATAIGLGAHLSWSPEDCDLERITFLPAEYYRQAAYRYGSELPWSSGGRSAEPPEEVLVSESELVDVLGFPSGSELDFLMTQARNYRGITCESFRKNGRPAGLVAAPGKANVTMSLSGRARHVTFLHCVNKQPVGMSLNTAKQEPYRGKTPGTYVFHYQDGTQAEFETRFRFHVNDWNDPAPASFAETGLSGVLSNSIEVNIPTYTWVNPHPDKELARLEIIPGTLQGLELVLLGLALD